jgi:subtilase family serine protease
MLRSLIASSMLGIILSGCGGGGDMTVSAVDTSIMASPHASDVTPLTVEQNVMPGASGVLGTLSPSNIREHYNIPSTVTGAGQTIVIVNAAGSNNIATDCAMFSSRYSLPSCNLQIIDLRSNKNLLSISDWALEIALDVEWAHAVAPGAKIILVTAASSRIEDMMAAVKVGASQPGVVALSMSWGTNEFLNETTAAYDGVFKQYPNIAFFASAGDSGNNGRNQQWPAASPYVTAVGGTTITKLGLLTNAGSEIAWSLSGGGSSVYEAMPAYQQSSLGDTALKLNNGKRAIPDIAYSGDGSANPFGVVAKGTWWKLGGTSAGAPQWAGIAALLAQSMQNKNTGTLSQMLATAGGLNSVLYQSKIEQAGKISLFDIISGNDNTSKALCLLCNASVGYDNVTGLGVPNVGNLLGYF